MNAYFIFDVESVGLHGEGFAVAGGVYLANGAVQREFQYACPIDSAHSASDQDLAWVKENVPVLELTHHTPLGIRHAFWNEWLKAKRDKCVMAVECGWPVEAAFLEACVDDDTTRNWEGPYPLHEIATYMVAAGMDPMAKYERTPSEMPPHNPLSDARLSARLLSESISRLSNHNHTVA